MSKDIDEMENMLKLFGFVGNKDKEAVTGIKILMNF